MVLHLHEKLIVADPLEQGQGSRNKQRNKQPGNQSHGVSICALAC